MKSQKGDAKFKHYKHKELVIKQGKMLTGTSFRLSTNTHPKMISYPKKKTSGERKMCSDYIIHQLTPLL